MPNLRRIARDRNDTQHHREGNIPEQDISSDVPPLHILRAFNSKEFRFYELSGDLNDALHFSHFEHPEMKKVIGLKGRIRLGDTVKIKGKPRIVLHEMDPDNKPGD